MCSEPSFRLAASYEACEAAQAKRGQVAGSRQHLLLRSQVKARFHSSTNKKHAKNMQGKTTLKKPKPIPERYNGWMYARDATKGVFSLLNTGKIYPAFGLMLIILMGIAEWRLPPEHLGILIRDFFATVRSSFGLVLALFFISNLTWFWLFARHKRLCAKEINRLTEIRHEYFHGKKITNIKNHRSSESVEHKTHIFPSSNQSDSKDE